MSDLGLTKATAGLLGSLTLVASAVGGLVFGLIADRFGRRRALMASIAIYSIFTAACGLANWGGHAGRLPRLSSAWAWAGSGRAAPRSSPRPGRRSTAARPWASSRAPGPSGTLPPRPCAALVLPLWGWRGVFFVGVVPAFFTLWIQKKVREPEIWKTAEGRPTGIRAGFGEIFGRKRLRLTVIVTLMNACTMFGWWGFNLWLPTYLSMPASEQGGIGLGPRTMSGLVIFMQVGMWLGYITFGFISDRLGRKRSYVGLPWSRPRRSCCSIRGHDNPWSFSRSARSSPFSGPATSPASAP